MVPRKQSPHIFFVFLRKLKNQHEKLAKTSLSPNFPISFLLPNTHSHTSDDDLSNTESISTNTTSDIPHFPQFLFLAPPVEEEEEEEDEEDIKGFLHKLALSESHWTGEKKLEGRFHGTSVEQFPGHVLTPSIFRTLAVL